MPNCFGDRGVETTSQPWNLKFSLSEKRKEESLVFEEVVLSATEWMEESKHFPLVLRWKLQGQLCFYHSSVSVFTFKN